MTVTITGNSASKVYNTSEQSVTGFTTDVGRKTISVALAEGSKAEAKGTDVGTYQMGLTEEDFVVTSDNYNNINVVVVDGALEITPITDEVTVTITGNKDTFTYDSNPHTVSGYDVVSISSLLYTSNDFTFSGTASVSRTEAGGDAMGLDKDQFTNTNENFTNVVFDVTDGGITITTRPVTITVNTTPYTYDGNPKTVTDSGKDYTVAPKTDDSGLLSGHDISSLKVVYGTDHADSKTYVGEYVADVNAKVIIKAGETDVTTNYAIKVVPGKLIITDGTETDPVDPNKVVVKTHEKGDSAYNLGETVTFTITVTNIYDEAKDITITENGNEAYITKIVKDGTTLLEKDLSDKVTTYELWSVGAGETVTITAVHVIDSDDILEGTYTNSVTASFNGGKEFVNKDEVKPADIDRTLKVEKTSVSAGGETLNPDSKVELGQTIIYEIAVTNAGNVPYSNVIVDDQLQDKDGEEWKNDSKRAVKIGEVKSNQTKTNSNWYSVDGTTVTINELQVGEIVTIEASYVVGDSDLKNYQVYNKVHASGDSIDGEKPEGESEDKRDTANPKLSMKKEADKQDVLAGESITYTLTVSNTGDGKATEVVVTDTLPPQLKLTEQDNAALAAAGLSYDSQNHVITWNAGIVEANSEKSISFTATVLTESELDEKGLEMKISNHAEITKRPGPATDPDPDDPDKEPDKDTEETAIARVDVQKSAQILNPDYSLKDGNKASLGDIIRFNVVVTNKGGCELNNVVVSDIMIAKAIAESIKVEPVEAASSKMGRSAENGSEVMTLATLPVGNKATFTYDYRVTEEDILKGSVSNVATADAQTEKGTEVTGKGESNTTTDEPAPSLNVEKTLVQ